MPTPQALPKFHPNCHNIKLNPIRPCLFSHLLVFLSFAIHSIDMKLVYYSVITMMSVMVVKPALSAPLDQALVQPVAHPTPLVVRTCMFCTFLLLISLYLHMSSKGLFSYWYNASVFTILIYMRSPNIHMHIIKITNSQPRHSMHLLINLIHFSLQYNSIHHMTKSFHFSGPQFPHI